MYPVRIVKLSVTSCRVSDEFTVKIVQFFEIGDCVREINSSVIELIKVAQSTILRFL